MQLHRNHSATLIDFASSLEKVAKVTAKDLVLDRMAEDRVRQLKASEDKYAPAKAFARGAGVSFALPLAYSLMTFDKKKQLQDMQTKSQVAYDEFHLKHGLMEGGLGKKEAESLAKIIVKNQKGLVDSTNPAVVPEIQLKMSIQNSIEKELRGVAKPNLTKSYSGPWKTLNTSNNQINQINRAIASGKPTNVAGTKQILQGISATYFGGKKDPDVAKQFVTHFVQPTADHIMKTEFKGLEAPGLLRRSQFQRLHDLGAEAVKKKGIPEFSPKKYQMDQFKSLIKGKVKTPAFLGILGGIAAVKRNKEDREKYKKLLNETRRRNARR